MHLRNVVRSSVAVFSGGAIMHVIGITAGAMPIEFLAKLLEGGAFVGGIVGGIVVAIMRRGRRAAESTAIETDERPPPLPTGPGNLPLMILIEQMRRDVLKHQEDNHEELVEIARRLNRHEESLLALVREQGLDVQARFGVNRRLDAIERAVRHLPKRKGDIPEGEAGEPIPRVPPPPIETEGID